MRYALAIEIKLQELPEEEPLPLVGTSDNPMAMLGSALGPALKSMTGAVVRPFNFGNAPGFDFRKQITIGVADFRGLAAIIGRFDELTNDIEHEKLQV